jgi:hypothetical protein
LRTKPGFRIALKGSLYALDAFGVCGWHPHPQAGLGFWALPVPHLDFFLGDVSFLAMSFPPQSCCVESIPAP